MAPELKGLFSFGARLRQGLKPRAGSAEPPRRTRESGFVDVRSFEDLASFKAFYQGSPEIFAPENINNAAKQIEKLGLYCPVFREDAEPAQVKIHDKNYRETVVYRGLNSRLRAVQHVLQNETSHMADSELRLYAPEAVTPYAKLLRSKYDRFIGSEYTDDAEAAKKLAPVRIEDLHALTFEDACFDAVVANEVFEHVPFLDKALSELARILVGGGKLVATFPFLALHQESVVRAKFEDGKIVHLTEPEYHGNPVDAQGSLVFELPGWNIIERTRAAGFSQAAMQWVYSPACGIISPGYAGILVMVATK